MLIVFFFSRRNSEFVDKKFKFEIFILVQFLSCFRPGGSVFGHVRLLSGVTTLEVHLLLLGINT